jgi:hypothetical protein
MRRRRPSASQPKSAERAGPKLNCWEFTQCGREQGGGRASERGLCPAATETRADGVHGGVNGGRVCWAIAGTLCDGRVQGSRASKMETCLACEFCLLVLKEEGASLAQSPLPP